MSKRSKYNASVSCFGPTISYWMDDPKKVKGTTMLNVEYMRQLKPLRDRFAQLAVLCYFIGKRLGITSAFVMMKSAAKQKVFLDHTIYDLKTWAVTNRHAKCFDNSIEKSNRRTETIFRICKENIRLTGHHLYFEAMGYDKLLDVDTTYTDSGETSLDPLIADMDAWEAKHIDEIEAYMETIKPELERRAKFIEKNVASVKAEKAAERAKKKAEREEIKMLKEQKKKYEKERKALDRDLDQVINRNASSMWLLKQN